MLFANANPPENKERPMVNDSSSSTYTFPSAFSINPNSLPTLSTRREHVLAYLSSQPSDYPYFGSYYIPPIPLDMNDKNEVENSKIQFARMNRVLYNYVNCFCVVPSFKPVAEKFAYNRYVLCNVYFMLFGEPLI